MTFTETKHCSTIDQEILCRKLDERQDENVHFTLNNMLSVFVKITKKLKHITCVDKHL